MNSKRRAFTLAENATHVDMSDGYRKAAFTLAEVLITLGIIGVVAAITLPTLLKNINNTVNKNKVTVIEKKLLQGINLLNSQDTGLNVPYSKTEDFVKALSKHMKIIQICSSNELTKCFPYEKISYESKSGKAYINVDDLSQASSIGLGADGFDDTAGFVTADGTSFIISYNKNCSEGDPDKNYRSIPTCIAGIYDLNGSKGPNHFGTDISKGSVAYDGDIRPFNNARIAHSCLISTREMCISSVGFVPEGITYEECQANKNSWEIDSCCPDCGSNGDLYAGAKKTCKQAGGDLPTPEQMANIVSDMYFTTQIPVSGTVEGLTYNYDSPISKMLETSLNSPSFTLMTNDGYDPNKVHTRQVWRNKTMANGHYRNRNEYLKAFCVDN